MLKGKEKEVPPKDMSLKKDAIHPVKMKIGTELFPDYLPKG